MDKKWIYFIQLSNHKSPDTGAGSSIRRFYFPETIEDAYKPENNVDFAVWDRVVKRAAECGYNTLLIDLGDAVQYKSHPEISAPDALSHEELRALLNKARALGLTPIPKLNFSSVHHNWLKEYSRMVSSKIYRQMTVDLINEACELFDTPEFFHLGMDEEHSYDCAQWSELTVMRSPALMLEDFNIMFDAVRKNGSRPWIWADLYWNHPDFFLKNVKKDIVLSNWFYLHFKDYPETDYHKRVIEAFKIFDEAGYDQIPTCSTYVNQTNPAETILFAPTVISDEHLLGYCNAPWLQVRENNEHLLLDSVERLWYARKRFAPETLK